MSSVMFQRRTAEDTNGGLKKKKWKELLTKKKERKVKNWVDMMCG